MNPESGKVTVVHGDPCGCTIDGEAVYVRHPCRVVGWHVTKRRIHQIIHRLRYKTTAPSHTTTT